MASAPHIVIAPRVSPRQDHDAREEPCGRFSEGVERLPDSEAKHHVGRFCDGIAAPIDTDAMPVGRFSNGIERDPLARSVVRLGSFADGYELVGRH